MKKRLTALFMAIMMALALLPSGFVAAYTEPSLTVERTPVGNTGMVLTASAGGMRGARISAVSSDESIARVSVSGDTVTVTGVPGAVGVARITVTAEDANGNRLVSEQDVPVGYTTFYFHGDSVTVIEGADSKWEVTGQNVADEADHDLTVSTDAQGNTVYTNNDDATLTVSIKKAGGAYAFYGTCTDGSINVKKQATGNTWLLLNGLDLTSSFTSPITIKKDSGACAVITALAGTENVLTDSEFNNGDVYGSEEDGGDLSNQFYAESAVIKAKSNTTVYINGEGSLTVNSNSKNGIKFGAGSWAEIADLDLTVTAPKNGISSENELEINSGSINVTSQTNDAIKASDDTETIGKLTIRGGEFHLNAADEGIMASGSVTITGGTFDIDCQGDAVKAENADETAGDLSICGGTFDITTQCDGFQAAGAATFRGGNITVLACGGSSNTSYDKDSDPSAKGIKAGTELTFCGGTYNINSADDALHSNGDMTILGGDFTLATTDDGIHADYTLNLGEYNGSDDDVNLTVTTCYEGIEGAHINGFSGNYTIWTNEDCMNAANSDLGNYAFTLRLWGGNYYCYGNTGDGVDSNGELTICGAYVEVYSPGNGNAALDSDGTMSIIGSTVMSVGAGDMVETPSYGIYVRFGSSGWGGGGSSISIQNNDVIAVYNSSNTKLFESTVHYHNANRTGSCVIFSSPQLSSGQTYKLYKNGSQIATATASGNSGGTIPTPQTGGAAAWQAVGELSEAYARMTSMTPGVGAVITNTNNSYALTGGASVSGTSVQVSSVTGGYSITNVSDANTWYRTNPGKLYCTVNGANYYLGYTQSGSGWNPTYAIAMLTSVDSAPSWTISANGSYARISTSAGESGGGPGGPGGSRTLYLAASGSSFTLSTSASNLYIYAPDSALASLQGTLEYLIDTDAGESVSEAEVLANATIRFKSGANASEQTLAWTDSRVEYAWSPEFTEGEPGVYELNVSVLGTRIGAIRVIAIGGDLGSTAPEPPELTIPDPPTDDPTPPPTDEPTPPPTEEPTEPPTGLIGDVDFDGSVTVTDALLIMRHAMNIITLSEEAQAVADVDGNGSITVTDALTAMRMALGIV
ncbi:MAG: carbohydrate-binding domain-containing protein [Clostridia bacterium]|nr:carbohydrate-binding domain-containing protein [Clostridia bacterium]